MLLEARAFALHAHGSQMYGSHPYIYHLDQVSNLLKDFGDSAQAIGYLHDVLEDTELEFAEIAHKFGLHIAQCVALLTDEAGATRKDRKIKTYAKLAQVKEVHSLALVVKTADRLANVSECVNGGNHRLLEIYKEEHPVFKDSIYRAGLCDFLWSELDKLIMVII